MTPMLLVARYPGGPTSRGAFTEYRYHLNCAPKGRNGRYTVRYASAIHVHRMIVEAKPSNKIDGRACGSTTEMSPRAREWKICAGNLKLVEFYSTAEFVDFLEIPCRIA